MSNKTNIKVSVWEKAIAENDVAIETLKGASGDITVYIKRTISAVEMLEMISAVVEACFDLEKGEFIPEAYDITLKSEILSRYAGFDASANIDKQYALIYNTNAYDLVMRNIDIEQLNEIIIAIKDKLRFRAELLTSTAIGEIGTIIKQFAEVANGVQAAFNGVEGQNMLKVLESLSNANGIDDEKIATIVTDIVNMKKDKK